MRSIDELKAASGDIQFEIDRLRYCEEASRRYNKKSDPELPAALREACLLHCRSLIDFFYPGKNPHKEDILATHYIEESALKFELPEDLREDRTRMNAMLAHLSYRRLGGNRMWDIERMVDHLIEQWNEFVGALPNDRKDWFKPVEPIDRLAVVRRYLEKHKTL